MSIRRILAASDFSAAAQRAADRAVQLAEAAGSSLLLLHARQHGSWLEGLGANEVDPQLRQQLDAAIGDALEAERSRLASGGVEVQAELLPDALYRELDGLLVRRPAQLLVMGAHGEASWKDLLLGSTADRVLRLHRLPVLLVRNPCVGPYARIALATDFSAASEQAARFALDLLPATRAMLVHAHEPEFQSSLAFAGVVATLRESYLGESARRAHGKMTQFAQRLGKSDALPALRSGRPGSVLPALVEEASIELMVLGVSGRSGIERGLLGSVSRHAATDLSCDVLLVPAWAVVSHRWGMNTMQ
ncbi:universal stress protein [Pseudomarimonas arenosa]|uniref:Universal stress protein n=1 Tax=Pseudomarimonas arenosa TaxID=2774145 RepID=A0AAW3ZQ35_9GAMM|nr:universal stress protein [Pseudomarimonas arenosa]MBD8528226.1 universal stress protein [Pseudomarimonas arenosa]